MENPTLSIQKLDNTTRRGISSSQLFHRIDKNKEINRKLQTSKDPRSFRNRIKKQTLENQKQNVYHHKYINKIKCCLKQNQNQMASTYLLCLRKQYDKMEKNINILSSKINIMKKQINYIRDKYTNQNQFSKQNNQQKLINKQNMKKQFEQKQQQAIMQTKILNHIITRMKQQHINNKNIWNYLEKILKQKIRQLKIKQEEVFQWDQSIHRTSEQISKVKTQYSKRNQHRQMKIQDYKNYVTTLEDQEKFQQDRRQRTFQLLSMQSNDIMDAKNVVLREVLMTNKVLDKVLEYKINNLLNNFQALQNCYHLIKTQTNIPDPQALVRKFFSYSEIFEQLTSKIRYYEQKQQNLLKRNKQLKQLQKQGESKKLQDDKVTLQGISQGYQQRQKLIQQYLQKQLSIKKIKTWVDKIYDFLGLKKTNFITVQNRLSNICQYMKKQVQKVQNFFQSQQKNQKTPIQKFQSAGVRLKKIIKQFSEQELRLRRSQAMSVVEVNAQQNEYLHQSRRAVKNKFLIKIQPSKIVKI